LGCQNDPKPDTEPDIALDLLLAGRGGIEIPTLHNNDH
jgi:hypothetical protein